VRIGIDLHAINDFMQGSQTYIYNITKSLMEIDDSNEYFLYFTSKESIFEALFLQKKNVHCKIIKPATRFIRIPIAFPLKLAIDRVDIFHCQYMGWKFSCPFVVSLHDIIHETAPKLYPTFNRYLMSLFYPISARLAAKVLTISNYTKEQIFKIYKIPRNKIEVIYCGVSNEFRVIKDQTKIKHIVAKYGIQGPYILFVGRIEPRKNIIRLIRAFLALRSETKINHKLVIAGMKDEQFKNFNRQIDKMQSEESVLFAGRVSQSDLPYMYNGADLFVYPSYGEGFGLPPLEAMACGVPVITSNTTSLPEVVGDAGVMIDPYDTGELVASMKRLLSDESHCHRLRQAGLQRAAHFTWEEAAKETLKVYQEINDLPQY
jgi:glycosyltransferase involved in cell wall biosynthesis